MTNEKYRHPLGSRKDQGINVLANRKPFGNSSVLTRGAVGRPPLCLSICASSCPARRRGEEDMVSLSDDEMQAVMELAAPVCPYDRGRFLRSIADELSGYPPERRGPGLVRQIALRHQQRLL